LLEVAAHTALVDNGYEHDEAAAGIVAACDRADGTSGHPVRAELGWHDFAATLQLWRADESLLCFAAYYILMALCLSHTPTDAGQSVRPPVAKKGTAFGFRGLRRATAPSRACFLWVDAVHQVLSTSDTRTATTRRGRPRLSAEAISAPADVEVSTLMLMLDGVRRRAAIDADLHEYIREAVETRAEAIRSGEDSGEGGEGAAASEADVLTSDPPGDHEQAMAAQMADRATVFVDCTIRRILAVAHTGSSARPSGMIRASRYAFLRVALFETMCAWQLASEPPHEHTVHAVLFASFVLAPVADLFALPAAVMALAELHVLLQRYRTSGATELLEYSLHVLSAARQPAHIGDGDADGLGAWQLEYARHVLGEADGLMRERLRTYAPPGARRPSTNRAGEGGWVGGGAVLSYR
jgi:hypothetical protein